jgi:hypothetical protein
MFPTENLRFDGSLIIEHNRCYGFGGPVTANTMKYSSIECRRSWNQLQIFLQTEQNICIES